MVLQKFKLDVALDLDYLVPIFIILLKIIKYYIDRLIHQSITFTESIIIVDILSLVYKIRLTTQK